MDLALTDDERAFQDEVRAFLDEALTPELRAAGRLATSVFMDWEYSRPWQLKLHAKGWAAPTWPKEYGGPGWGEMKRAIFAAELARAGAPPLPPQKASKPNPSKRSTTSCRSYCPQRSRCCIQIQGSGREAACAPRREARACRVNGHCTVPGQYRGQSIP